MAGNTKRLMLCLGGFLALTIPANAQLEGALQKAAASRTVVSSQHQSGVPQAIRVAQNDDDNEPPKPNPIITGIKKWAGGIAIRYGEDAYKAASKTKKVRAGRPQKIGSYYPAPKQGPPVKGVIQEKSMTRTRGGGNLRPRWKGLDGKFYEWDFQEEEWEIYDRTGKKHLGSINQNGDYTGDAVPGREIKK